MPFNHINKLARRDFLKGLGAFGVGAGLMPVLSLAAKPGQEPQGANAVLYKRLLTQWCDAMVKLQVTDSVDPDRLGAIACPACRVIHGRNW